jgi:hypothetical protein
VKGSVNQSASKGHEEPHSAHQTPNPLNIKVEHHSSAKKPAAKAHSKYFTVQEDSQILTVNRKYKGKKDAPVQQIAEEAHSLCKDKSVAEIRDRITHFFVGMTKTEEDKITKAAAVDDR